MAWLRTWIPIHHGFDPSFTTNCIVVTLAGALTMAVNLSARQLDDRITQPNLLVKIPATAPGIPAIRAMIAEGRSINITLIFSIDRLEPMARRSSSDSAGLKPATSMAICISCSWNSGTPSVRFRIGSSDGCG